jgi:signal transduction histidine kinase
VVGSLVLARRTEADANALAFLGFALACAVVGYLVASRRPEHPVGWLLVLIGACFALPDFAGRYAFYGLVVEPGSLPGAQALLWPQTWLWVPATAALTVVLPLHFPDGLLPSPRWRPLLWSAVAWTAVVGGLAAVTPGDSMLAVGIGSGLENPLGIEALRPWNWVVEQVAPFVLLAMAVPAAASLVLRYRRADGLERAQLGWLAYAVVASLVMLPLTGLLVTGLDAVASLVFAGIPIAIGVAVLRYRLYDIDLLVNRTLVYVGLSAVLLGVYLAVAAAASAVLAGDSPTASAVVAAGLVAVLVAPLRSRAQSAVNRLMYGDREDPRAALARLGRQLEATLTVDDVLPAAVAAVAESLRVPYVAVEMLGGADRVVVDHGTRSDGPRAPLRMTLTYGGETVGSLLVEPRSGDVGFSAADRDVLDVLARQIGAAVHSVQLRSEARLLAEDLQRSRQRLVVAREEERRRLGRDLHDEIGPRLAGIAMQVDAARVVLPADPAHAEELLASVLEQTAATVDGVRRAAHELRPPALDSLGLVEALRAHVATVDQGPLDIEVQAPPLLPPLSAAVEIAAYRIVLEALNNVLRHADARRCTVRLALAEDAGLVVTVVDDGHGYGDDRAAGVGLASMRERATELGGTWTIEPVETGGTCVTAVLPGASAERPQQDVTPVWEGVS